MKYEKQIDALGKEIYRVWEQIYIIQELINQSHDNLPAYAEFHSFFFEIYRLSHNEIIYGINRLIDNSGGSLSVIKMLKWINNHDDVKANKGKEVLESLTSHKSYDKMRTLRDKLGRAHLDGEYGIDEKKAADLHESSAGPLNDTIEYLKLLTEALEILAERLDIPFKFLPPIPTVSPVMRKLFEKISQK